MLGTMGRDTLVISYEKNWFLFDLRQKIILGFMSEHPYAPDNPYAPEHPHSEYGWVPPLDDMPVVLCSGAFQLECGLKKYWINIRQQPVITAYCRLSIFVWIHRTIPHNPNVIRLVYCEFVCDFADCIHSHSHRIMSKHPRTRKHSDHLTPGNVFVVLCRVFSTEEGVQHCWRETKSILGITSIVLVVSLHSTEYPRLY